MKRRWTVVMLGLRGLAAGHRSELSRHRSQESARIAALEALARLREGQTNLGPDYTVVVEHDGERYLVDDSDPTPVSDPWGERVQAARLHGPAPLEGIDDPGDADAAEEDPSDDAQEAAVPVAVPAAGEAEEAVADDAQEAAVPVAVPAAGEAAVADDAQRSDEPQASAGERPAPSVRRRREVEPDTPAGPVPEGLLSTWEKKVAAYEEWEARQADRDRDDS